jgi:hypothetical protein
MLLLLLRLSQRLLALALASTVVLLAGRARLALPAHTTDGSSSTTQGAVMLQCGC